MQALRLIEDGRLQLEEVPEPPAPAAGEVVVRMKAVALNHIDLWGFRGMAFAKRKLPIVVGVEGAGEIAAVGAGVTNRRPGDAVAIYAGLFCGHCGPCRRGQENLCENIADGGIMGFHRDGVAAQYVPVPVRQTVPVPQGVGWAQAATAPVTFGTVQHMLFDNAKLLPGETILVHAGASGIGTTAILMAKAIGARVLTTVGSDEKMVAVKALGADHVLNYRKDRFETWARRLTGEEGRGGGVRACRPRHLGRQPAVAEARRKARHLRLDQRHLGGDQSLPSLPAADPHHRLLRRHGAQSGGEHAKMAIGEALPVIDSEIPLSEFDKA